MNNKQVNYDLIIVGAGIVGMTLALLANRHGFTPLLLDKNNPLKKDHKRVFTINYPSKLLLQEIGVWEKLNSKTAVRKMVVKINNTPHVINAYDAGYAQVCDTVLEDELNKELHKLITSSKIATNFSSDIKQIDRIRNGVDLICSENTYHGKLMAAADGKNSIIRKLLNIKEDIKDLQQTALVANLKVNNLNNSAWQWMKQDYVLALLPSTNNTAGLVWSVPTNIANKLFSQSKQVLLIKLNEVIADDNLTCTSIDNINTFNLQSSTSDLIHEQVAFVGDSAHTIHPLSGQGIALGLGDVIELINSLKENKHNYQQALRQYENLRSLRINATRIITDNQNCLINYNFALPSSLGKLTKFIDQLKTKVLVKLANRS